MTREELNKGMRTKLEKEEAREKRKKGVLFFLKLTVFLIIFFAALLLTIGAPGISHGGIIMDISLLSILGIPLSFVGLYAGIYRALDAGYTAVNVLGDITANILLGYKRKQKKA